MQAFDLKSFLGFILMVPNSQYSFLWSGIPSLVFMCVYLMCVFVALCLYLCLCVLVCLCFFVLVCEPVPY